MEMVLVMVGKRGGVIVEMVVGVVVERVVRAGSSFEVGGEVGMPGDDGRAGCFVFLGVAADVFEEGCV